jgi:Uma2 family endonuclease
MEVMARPPRTGMEAFKLMPEGTLCQLINDKLVMSPAPNIPHANVQNEIFNAIFGHVKINQLGIVYSPVVDVYLNEKNVYQPDILYISNERKGIIKNEGIFGAPDLIIEILSKGTWKIDRVKKKEVYQSAGVKEYWIIDPLTKWCEGFISEDGQFKSVGESTGSLTIKMFDLKITF